MSARTVTKALVLALAAGAGCVAGSAQAQAINVNFNGFTGGNLQSELGSTLEGPAGGLGMSWNQYADEDSTGVMVDADGLGTTVTFTTNFSEGRTGSTSNLPIFRSTLTDFNRGLARNLTINGLLANALYNVWIVAYRDSGTQVERLSGTWSTTNPTVSPSAQVIDSSSIRNGSTFQAGVNYALFENVQADESGRIVFSGQALIVTEPVSGDDYRLGLSGFQITPGGLREPLEMTDFVYDDGSDEITLTWKSNPGDFYGLYWSEDLDGFEPGVNPAVPAHGTDTRTTYGPFANPRPGADRLFVRVGPPDLEDPALARLWGNGSTITLVFSEPLHPAAANDPASFVVAKVGGGPVVVDAAVLAPDGMMVELTTATPLEIGTSFTVTMNNLTDLAGRPLGTPSVGNFQTWDNDPTGVKVFILAGQSNMVGHGKSELGHDDNGDGSEDPGAIGSLRYFVVNNAATYGHLLVTPGNPATSAWATRSDVKVWWRDSDVGDPRAVLKDDLRIGFSQSRNPAWFGPEYGFGWVLGDHYDEPVLLIKTCWGGKNLNVDFRPPSAVAARGGVVGPYYTGMIDYVRDVLGKLGTEFPEWAGMGYQIAGVGWHQGWNDRVTPGYPELYEDNLVDLINDLRAEFGRPGLPISIGTTGMEPQPSPTPVELAQLAVADPQQHPEFDGTVFTVDTSLFWRASDKSPSSFGYHWNHNGESHFLIGDAMGQGMVDLLGP